MRRIFGDIDEEEYKRLKLYCVVTERQQGEVVAEAVTKYLSRHEKEIPKMEE